MTSRGVGGGGCLPVSIRCEPSQPLRNGLSITSRHSAALTMDSTRNRVNISKVRLVSYSDDLFTTYRLLHPIKGSLESDNMFFLCKRNSVTSFLVLIFLDILFKRQYERKRDIKSILSQFSRESRLEPRGFKNSSFFFHTQFNQFNQSCQ